jgi:hypothetical protein
MTDLREISADDLKSLAVGAGILGTGGGTHPYLELLNIEALYRGGRRVQLLDPDDLVDGDLVAEVGFMGAPLVTKERLPDPEHVCKPVRLMAAHSGQSFKAVMSSEIGGENGVLPLLVAALLDLPLLDADPRGRAFPEMQMSSFAIAGLPLFPVALADIRDNAVLILRSASARWQPASRRARRRRSGPTRSSARSAGQSGWARRCAGPAGFIAIRWRPFWRPKAASPCSAARWSTWPAARPAASSAAGPGSKVWTAMLVGCSRWTSRTSSSSAGSTARFPSWSPT